VPADSISQYWLKDGDILVVRSSLKREGIGQNCVARNLSESVFYDCHLIRVQTDPRKLIPEFLSMFWRSDIGKNDLVLRSKTTTMTTINQQGISKALVPVAPIDEQSEIVDLLETVDTKIRRHRAQKQQLEDLFRTLLHELMTAKTRVHKLEITA
jgi:type I restriction enzyme S subunit